MKKAWQVGGLSIWTLLAVASLILVLPTSLSVLYSGSTTLQNGGAYSTETVQFNLNEPYWPSGSPPVCVWMWDPGSVTFRGIEFQVWDEAAETPDHKACGNSSIVGKVIEPGGGSHSLVLLAKTCPPENCSTQFTPDGLAGIELNTSWGNFGLPFTLMVSVTVLPGVSVYAGPIAFGAGVVGLVAYAASRAAIRFRSPPENEPNRPEDLSDKRGGGGK